MASICKELRTRATAETVWDAVRDIGALHTRLVPGFVVKTELESGARVVTFGNGWVVREAIVTIDESRRRLVWSAASERLSHYNSSLQVFNEDAGCRVVWLTDLLPDSAAAGVEAMMSQGLAAMQRTLDVLSPSKPQNA